MTTQFIKTLTLTNNCMSSENVTTINISLFGSQMHKGRKKGILMDMCLNFFTNDNNNN